MTHACLDVDPRADLRPDCTRCAALCCTLLGFTRSADFPVDKPAGTPCGELSVDFACTIHDRLRPRGFRGCTVFECSGAGQRVTQEVFGGVSWRARPDLAPAMSAAFAVVRVLHELAWYLTEVADRSWDPDTAEHAAAMAADCIARSGSDPATLAALDLSALRGTVLPLLDAVRDEARARFAAADEDVDERPLPEDLAGRDLRRAVRRGSSLRNAVLIGSDLRGTDLSGVELLGADLRGARLAGADLSGALLLTQSQVNAADGDERTLLPTWLEVPSHWLHG
ncbi:pentapeptide repeat-containing protein [Curtobacterium sp. RHCJP20]|uniref:Pentapeptide repeat-containing protein n=1 Tax=Curtobacterium subtropicum TaxID=3055138 RepID=A0ABT7TIK8_9MICO|nr:pentapeptide repeat-containing protein [Curtobacterium subtropicum]MDM7889204.1 pentapeptide repeat-containing protein [Curtobacterium subtropicum]